MLHGHLTQESQNERTRYQMIRHRTCNLYDNRVVPVRHSPTHLRSPIIFQVIRPKPTVDDDGENEKPGFFPVRFVRFVSCLFFLLRFTLALSIFSATELQFALVWPSLVRSNNNNNKNKSCRSKGLG